MPETRIGRLFERLRAEGRKGLIAYLTAGDPAPERTPESNSTGTSPAAATSIIRPSSKT